MKLSPAMRSREEELILRIRQISAGSRLRRSRLKLSIGDDAAAFQVRHGHHLLVSTDALVEGIHFDLSYFRPEELGWKALAVNLSDIAAMGGRPLFFTTSIALPKHTDPRFVQRFYQGVNNLARKFGVELAGGDTCASPQGIFIDLTVLGEVKPSEMIGRSGARPGDLIYVSGELGGSAMGLELLKQSSHRKRSWSGLVERHLRPVPRCRLGRFLAQRGLATALIDLSDGLSTDLHHLCSASGVGAVIEAQEIPVARLSPSVAACLDGLPLDYAVNGGEDYELLFTVSERLRQKVPSSLGGVAIRRVGVITDKPLSCYFRQKGTTRRLLPRGFDHFADC
jgi:thiamine-monophosphate kinase